MTQPPTWRLPAPQIRSYTPTEIDIKVLFTLDGNDKGLRGHSKKICKVRFNIDVRKYFFSNRVIDKWNNLDQDTVDAPSLNSFKNRLNRPHKVSTR